MVSQFRNCTHTCVTHDQKPVGKLIPMWNPRGEGGHRHAHGQDTGEDVGVGKEVEGRWSHCDLKCIIYSHILEDPGTLHWKKKGILYIHDYYYSIS